MNKYFGILLEFDQFYVKEKIEINIANFAKGYVCIVDANVLTIAQKDNHYRAILNNSIVNSCDGSSIAMLAGFIYKRKFRAWNGPDIFSYYIEKNYHHLLLGSTEDVSNEIIKSLVNRGIDNKNISVLSLPFSTVEDFDYLHISNLINNIGPDIIWVSLGAPKQEIFMYKLLPHLTRGVMFGIGAAFNFYLGKIPNPHFKIGALKFIWISRIIREPKKQLSRIFPYVLILPKLFFSELMRRKNRISHL